MRRHTNLAQGCYAPGTQLPGGIASATSTCRKEGRGATSYSILAQAGEMCDQLGVHTAWKTVSAFHV